METDTYQLLEVPDFTLRNSERTVCVLGDNSVILYSNHKRFTIREKTKPFAWVYHLIDMRYRTYSLCNDYTNTYWQWGLDLWLLNDTALYDNLDKSCLKRILKSPIADNIPSLSLYSIPD